MMVQNWIEVIQTAKLSKDDLTDTVNHLRDKPDTKDEKEWKPPRPREEPYDPPPD